MGFGVLFAVPADTVEKLRDMPVNERPVYISEELEELYFEEYPERTYELEESWEAIHRALTGGFDFDSDSPLAPAILGGEVLYFDGEKHDDYIITAKPPLAVRALCDELSKLDAASFTKMYKAIPAADYPDKSSEDLEETLEFFENSLAFWKFAADSGLWVLFTADL
ncbi:MAG: DUF1877 family protein [Ruminococcus sp.]|nr:DUF1877 family protein [Ruminococcus sp.]